MVNFKICDVTIWERNHCTVRIGQYLGKQRQSDNKIWSFNRIYHEHFFLKNHTQNVVEKLVPDPFLGNENWAYQWINSLKFLTVCFYCMPSWGLSRYIKNLATDHLLLPYAGEYMPFWTICRSFWFHLLWNVSQHEI